MSGGVTLDPRLFVMIRVCTRTSKRLLMRTALVGVMRWATLVVFVSTLFPADATSVLWGLEADDLESGLPVPLSHYRGKVLPVSYTHLTLPTS